MRADVLVDLGFGSTGKGAVAGYLVTDAASRYKHDTSVRVQSIQAGHTVYYKDKPYKMRTIPCAWINPNVNLVLGPGCFVEKQLLLDEIDMINEAMGGDVRERLFIDTRVFTVEGCDVDVEIERNIENGIGSTAHGCGASLIRKIWRDQDMKEGVPCGQLRSDVEWISDYGLTRCFRDTIDFIQNKVVLVEGCQGAMLSIHTSPYYPYVTSREATASGIIAEAGIAPRDVRDVFGVFRTLPIRVGGNSGDTGAVEISWDEVSHRAGYDVPPERTTVTNRVRRIFEFSDHDMVHALRVNKPTELYMTFANYLTPCYHARSLDAVEGRDKLMGFVYHIESLRDSAMIRWINTGEKPEDYILR